MSIFKLTYSSSLIITAMLIGSALAANKPEKVEAVVETAINTPFTDNESEINKICCNGIILDIENSRYQTVASGEMIFPWQNMIPIDTLGWGLFEHYQLDGATVLGRSMTGGVCITIESECESEEDVDWTIYSMGTNQI